MSTEVATTADQFVPVLGSGFGDPLGTVTLYADMIDTAYNLAVKLCRTPLVGTVYRGKPADAAVAILYGAEIGLNPIQALQQIFTVHGTPAIYARTMVALLKRRGYRFQTVESTDEQVTVTGTSPTGDTETSTWTIGRAEKAGYVPQIDERTGKYATNANNKLIGNEKYLTDPQAMLYAKAAAEVSRKLAPDVLLGISRTGEDLESESESAPVHVVSERVSAADVLGTPAAGEQSPPVVVEWAADESAEAPIDVDEVSSESAEKSDAPQDSAPGTEVDPPSTRIQQKKIARLLTEQGVDGDLDKLDAIRVFLGREIASADDITRGEGIRLLAHLEDTSAEGIEGGAE